MILMWFDGSTGNGNPGLAGIGACAYQHDAGDDFGVEVWAASKPVGLKPNNETELLALRACLIWAELNKHKRPDVYGDSQFAIKIATGKYRAHAAHIKAVAGEVLRLMAATGATLHWVPREENVRADWLSKQGAKQAGAR